MADDSKSMTPVQAAVAAGLAVGGAIVILFGAPLWAGILAGSGVAVGVNKAIDRAA